MPAKARAKKGKAEPKQAAKAAKAKKTAGADGTGLVCLAARIADEMRATDVTVYDLHGVADFTDFFVVATAVAATQRRAITRAIARRLREDGHRPLGTEGADSDWTLLDFGGFVVHLFSPELRTYYDLDLLWGDCPRVDWEAEK